MIHNNRILILFIAWLYYILGLWEFYILFSYQHNHEYVAYIYTIIKSLFNFILCIYIISKISNKFLNFIIILISGVLNIWVLNLFCNLDNYNYFVIVIIVEFFILNIQSNIIVLVGLYNVYIIWIKPTIQNNIIEIIIEIPYAIPYAIPDNLESLNDNLPQATQLK